MKSRALLVLSMVFFSTASSWAWAGQSEIENPTLVCEDTGVKVAFEGFQKRAWQTDPGKKDGLPLKVDAFKQVLPVLYDWQVTGRLEVDLGSGSTEIHVRYRTHSRAVGAGGTKFKVKLDIYYRREGESFRLVKRSIPCLVLRKSAGV